MTETGKTLNHLLSELDRTYLSPRALARPCRIFVAVSDVCNIRCPYCPRQYYGAQIENRLMPVDRFRRFASELRHAETASLFGAGEPFLNPDFFEFLRLAKEAGARVATSTHGMSLEADVCARLVEMELDELEISIDAPRRKLFEFLRRGAKFDAVIANARNLHSMKVARDTSKPAVNVAVTVSRHNVGHLAGMVRLARKIGADRIVFTDMIVVDPNEKDLSAAGTRDMERNLLRARRVADKLGQEMLYFPQNPFPWKTDDLKKAPPVDRRTRPDGPLIECEPPIIEARDERFGCPDLWGTLVIESDGAARPCCYIGEKMGDAFETPLADIENGEKKVRLRRALTQGQLPSTCRDCRNLVRATPEHVARQIDTVERMAADADLDDAERRVIADRLAEYRRHFAERENAS